MNVQHQCFMMFSMVSTSRAYFGSNAENLTQDVNGTQKTDPEYSARSINTGSKFLGPHSQKQIFSWTAAMQMRLWRLINPHTLWRATSFGVTCISMTAFLKNVFSYCIITETRQLQIVTFSFWIQKYESRLIQRPCFSISPINCEVSFLMRRREAYANPCSCKSLNIIQYL